MDQIHEWWNSRPYNLGIATGRSGLHVVDLDAARGEFAPEPWTGARHGRDVLARVAELAGYPYPGDTLTVRTPGGGEHLYFRAPEMPVLRNTAGRLGWRVDSRGSGGYVVGPGSVTSNCYRVVRDVPIAALPEWLVPLLTPSGVPELAVVERDGPLAEHRKEAYLIAVRDNVAAAPTGKRRLTLLKAACALGRLVAGGDISPDEARSTLCTAAARFTAFPAREADRTIEDGIRFGSRFPRRLPG